MIYIVIYIPISHMAEDEKRFPTLEAQIARMDNCAPLVAFLNLGMQITNHSHNVISSAQMLREKERLNLSFGDPHQAAYFIGMYVDLLGKTAVFPYLHSKMADALPCKREFVLVWEYLEAGSDCAAAAIDRASKIHEFVWPEDVSDETKRILDTYKEYEFDPISNPRG